MDLMKMVKKLANDFVKFLGKLNKFNLKEKLFLLAIFALLYCVVGILLGKCALTMEKYADFTNLLGGNKEDHKEDTSDIKDVFVMYSMSSCKFCKEAKPEFNKLIEKNLPNTECKIIEDAKDDAEWSDIKGFPAFKLHKKDGSVEVYGENTSKCLNEDCSRKSENLEHFVNECSK